MMRFLFFSVILLQLSLSAWAGHIFKESDLDKYKDRPQDTAASTYNGIANEEEKAEYPDLNKWCRRWVQYQNDLDEAMKERDYTKYELEERYKLSRTYIDQAVDKYQRAIIAVEDIKKKIDEFRDKAYRAGLPKLSYECKSADSFDYE